MQAVHAFAWTRLVALPQYEVYHETLHDVIVVVWPETETLGFAGDAVNFRYRRVSGN